MVYPRRQGLSSRVVDGMTADIYLSKNNVIDKPFFKQKLFGEKHHDIGISLNNLATLLQQSGKTNQARELFARSLTIFEKTLGADRPNTRLCQENAKCCAY